MGSAWDFWKEDHLNFYLLCKCCYCFYSSLQRWGACKPSSPTQYLLLLQWDLKMHLRLIVSIPGLDHTLFYTSLSSLLKWKQHSTCWIILTSAQKLFVLHMLQRWKLKWAFWHFGISRNYVHWCLRVKKKPRKFLQKFLKVHFCFQRKSKKTWLHVFLFIFIQLHSHSQNSKSGSRRSCTQNDSLPWCIYFSGLPLYEGKKHVSKIFLVMYD